MFPVGSTSVVCTATDSRQRTDSCTFSVVVQQQPRISLTRFEAFGDSITWGEDGRNSGCGVTSLEIRRFGLRPQCQFPTSQTYPGALAQKLKDRYPTQLTLVANAGCPGEAVGAGHDPCYLTNTVAVDRFRTSIDTRVFEAVLLMEGTNDIFYGDAAQIDPAVASLRTMVQYAKSRSVRPYLATVPPIIAGAPRGFGAALVPALNAQIRTLALAENITLVDVWAAFGADFQQYLGFDGLHPNEAGYAKIADTYFSALTTTLEVKATVTTAGTQPPAAPQPRSPYSPVRPRR